MAATTTSMAATGIVLEPLTSDNYDSWSALVNNYLIGQGLWDVVNFVPEITVRSKKDSYIWNRQNAKALHIIQLACGSEFLSQIKDLKTAKEAWNKLAVLYGSESHADPDIERGVVDDFPGHNNKSLHRYVECGEWNDAKAIILMDDTETVILSISSMGRTVLHVAVIAGYQNIAENLVKLGKEKLLKIKDKFGYTALALAAEFTGNVDIAKCMVEYKKGDLDLLTMETKDDEIPVLLSAARGHKQMTRYLYSQTHPSAFDYKNFRNVFLLLSRCVQAEIFDVALSLIHRFPDLPLAQDSDGSRPLYALARMPSAFPSGCRFGLVQYFIYNFLRLERLEIKWQKSCGITIQIVSDVPQTEGLNVGQNENQHNTSFAGRFFEKALNFPPAKLLVRLLIFVHLIFQKCILLRFSKGIREIYEQKKAHVLVLEILNCLRERISEYEGPQLRQTPLYYAMLQAAELGIVEFINAMRKANPDLLWVVDKNKRGIFAHAILNRRKDVFQLINRVNGRKEFIKDVFRNNLLHLAGYLGPSTDLDRTSGAALQMQRELQWFKDVEKIVHPKCKEEKNADGKKPREVFSERHVEMVKAGEKWAKDTATSFTLVATLIITMTFAAAFTVPGGNNQDTGVPIFLHDDTLFNLFIIADAISLFASSTSVLLSIGILTSRYAEKDFLWTLPMKLLFGLVALFVSVVAMMVAFCASLAMMLKGYQRVIIAALSLGSIPVVVLVLSQLGLFLQIFKSTIHKTYFK